jgi:hypothetical protein
VPITLSTVVDLSFTSLDHDLFCYFIDNYVHDILQITLFSAIACLFLFELNTLSNPLNINRHKFQILT